MDGTPDRSSERFETVIIGGGQAGLAVGYQLAARGRPFVILDEHDRVGDAWRTRWDSLRLFTPAGYDGLEGWRYPADSVSFPTKDEMADYLEAYGKRFGIPVRTGAHVESLTREGDRFVARSGDLRFEADNVVVATGANQTPSIPAFAGELDGGVVQLHSFAYKNPGQLQDGNVLVVGVGNSGAEIALDVARTHTTWISGKPSGQIPFRHGPTSARFAFPVLRFMFHHVLTRGTPIGRRLGPKLEAKGPPLVRVKLKDLAAAGVQRVPRTTGVQDGVLAFEGGRVLDAANVIWCTGFRYDFGWIDLPVIDESGEPIHDRGVAVDQQGLYFMGLVFQYAVSSDVLPGMSRDAAYIAGRIAARTDGSPAVA